MIVSLSQSGVGRQIIGITPDHFLPGLYALLIKSLIVQPYRIVHQSAEFRDLQFRDGIFIPVQYIQPAPDLNQGHGPPKQSRPVSLASHHKKGFPVLVKLVNGTILGVQQSDNSILVCRNIYVRHPSVHLIWQSIDSHRIDPGYQIHSLFTDDRAIYIALGIHKDITVFKGYKGLHGSRCLIA